MWFVFVTLITMAQAVPTASPTPAPTVSLPVPWALYVNPSENFNVSSLTWKDVSGNGRDAVMTAGGAQVFSNATASYIFVNRSSIMMFPATSIQSPMTFVARARYSAAGAKERAFVGANNQIFGWWKGNDGVFYANGPWNVSPDPPFPGPGISRWAVVAYRTGGVQPITWFNGLPNSNRSIVMVASDTMTINGYNEPSDFDVSEVRFYDVSLSVAQMDLVNTAMMNPLPPTIAPTGAPSTTPTPAPSATPTVRPTDVPTPTPTAVPTASPTRTPTATPTAAPTFSPSEGYDIFITAGQSNAVGRGSPYVNLTNSRVFQLSWVTNTTELALEPVSNQEGATEVGYSITAAVNYINISAPTLNRRVLLINCAVSGTSVSTWLGSLVDVCVARVNLSLAIPGNHSIKAIYWHQGESGDGTVTQYRDRLIGVVQAFRTKLGYPNLPFLLGHMAPDSMDNAGRWAINRVIHNTHFLVPYSLTIADDGLVSNAGFIGHFDTPSQHLMGVRYNAARPTAEVKSSVTSLTTIGNVVGRYLMNAFAADVGPAPVSSDGNSSAMIARLVNDTTRNSFVYRATGSAPFFRAPVQLGGSFAVSFWWKYVVRAGLTTALLKSEPGFAVQFVHNTQAVSVVVGNVTFVTSSTQASANDWLHIAVRVTSPTVNGTLVRIMVNSVVQFNGTADNDFVIPGVTFAANGSAVELGSPLAAVVGTSIDSSSFDSLVLQNASVDLYDLSAMHLAEFAETPAPTVSASVHKSLSCIFCICNASRSVPPRAHARPGGTHGRPHALAHREPHRHPHRRAHPAHLHARLLPQRLSLCLVPDGPLLQHHRRHAVQPLRGRQREQRRRQEHVCTLPARQLQQQQRHGELYNVHAGLPVAFQWRHNLHGVSAGHSGRLRRRRMQQLRQRAVQQHQRDVRLSRLRRRPVLRRGCVLDVRAVCNRYLRGRRERVRVRPVCQRNLRERNCRKCMSELHDKQRQRDVLSFRSDASADGQPDGRPDARTHRAPHPCADAHADARAHRAGVPARILLQHHRVHRVRPRNLSG